MTIWDVQTLRTIARRGGYTGVVLFVVLVALRYPLEAFTDDLSSAPAHIIQQTYVALLILILAVCSLSCIVYVAARREGRLIVPFGTRALELTVLLTVTVAGFYYLQLPLGDAAGGKDPSVVERRAEVEPPVGDVVVASEDASPGTADPLTSLAPKPKASARLTVCTGEHAVKCPAGSRHLSCGADVAAWAQTRCATVRIVGLGSAGGDRCGYDFYEVICTGPLP